jgi:hypothetical protein
MNATEIVAYFMMLSVAVERGVAIIKNAVPFLSAQSEDALRKFVLQVLPVALGTSISVMLQDTIQAKTGIQMKEVHHAIMGVLLGGGSGFWFNILTYIKTIQVTSDKLVASAATLAEKDEVKPQ